MSTCGGCGQDNPDGAHFCNACGAVLQAEGAAPVRKVVTAVFCDLVGSTALGDRIDPELLRELMAHYHATLRTVLERHGGTVEKFVGDAAMAVFGIPHAHEDDALRAVRAAFEMREAVEGLGLQTRTGVNTGEVLAGGGETLVTGDAINLAARLEQAAGKGEILLGELTHGLVKDVVLDEPLEPLVVKGKSEPVRAYRLLDVPLGHGAIARSHEAPFVGRATELAVLRDALDRAIDDREPRVVTIVGAPGIGKSRLWRELAASVDARVVVGRCLSYGEGITYWPLSEIVTQIGDVRSVVGDAAEGGLVAERVEAAIHGSGAAASTEEIAWGFRRLFEAMSRAAPLIVVVDDIHWAEPTLLDLIEYISTFASDAPLLLVCTARPDLFGSRPTWAAPGTHTMVVALGPLTDEESTALLDGLEEADDDRKARIVETGEGNPFFLEQLVAVQQEQGEEGRAEVPATIQALLAARIDRLEPGERRVVERGSIEGRTFHRGAVAQLSTERERSQVGGELLALIRKDMIRPDRATIEGDDAFRFTHGLIRDAAYASIPKRLRAELHQRFAEWLQPRLGNDVPPVIVAHHLERAHDYRMALGSVDGSTAELASRAAHILVDAGGRAHAQGDDRAAGTLLSRAIRLLPADRSEVPSLLVLLATSTFETGDVAGALEIARRAGRLAADTGQRGVELRARMVELALTRGGLEPAGSDALVAEIRAAVDELRALDDEDSLSHAWKAMIEIGFLRADFDMVGRASSELLACARRTGTRRDEVWAVRGLAAALAYGPEPTLDAIARVEQALATFPLERAGEDHLALLYAYAGRLDDAEQAIERSRQVALGLGQTIEWAGMCIDLAGIALLADTPERAEAPLRAAAEELERAGEEGLLASIAGCLAQVLCRLHRDAEAQAWTVRSERAASPEDVDANVAWRSVRAKLAARRGDTLEALRLSTEAVAIGRSTDNPFTVGACLLDRAEVFMSSGRPAEAAPALNEALGLFERKGIVPAAERTRWLLSQIGAE